MRAPATLLSFALTALIAGDLHAQGSVRVDAPRPIEAGESLWTEELTWMELAGSHPGR